MKLIDLEQVPMIASMEAEQAVIGGLLLDNGAFWKLGDLSEKAFYFQPNRLIYREIIKMLNADKVVDMLTLSESLESGDLLDSVGGLAYLADVMQHTPSSANIGRYAQIVRERYGKRVLLDTAQQVAELAVSQDGASWADKQAEAVRLVNSAVQAGVMQSKSMSAVELAREYLDHLDERMSMPDGALLGYGTGLPALNYTTQGLRRGDLTVIGGRPSMGKSVLAENISRACLKQGLIVRFQSYEMSGNDLVARGASAECGIDYSNMRKARLTHDELMRFQDYLSDFSDWKLTVNTEMLNIDQIASECREMKHRGGLDVLIIDHLHLMPRPNKNTVQELDEITAKCKRLAMELDIHVIVVAQLSRGSESRTDKRPTMADLRESGGIEQNANLILFPYRPSYYDSQANPTEAELIVAKNRDGERGTLYIGFEGKYQRFVAQADPSALPEALPSGDSDDAWNV